jgi:hemoglobin-like flavoprotein
VSTVQRYFELHVKSRSPRAAAVPVTHFALAQRLLLSTPGGAGWDLANNGLLPTRYQEYGAMTSEDILLVQQSWLKIAPVKQVTAELFYMKLSELDPGLRGLFDADLHDSSRRFVQLLDATVRGLDRADVLMGAVREVGIRNPAFGTSDRHHGTVAAALLWTLAKALRRDFTPAVKTAWIKVFGVLSQTLRAPLSQNDAQAA